MFLPPGRAARGGGQESKSYAWARTLTALIRIFPPFYFHFQDSVFILFIHYYYYCNCYNYHCHHRTYIKMSIRLNFHDVSSVESFLPSFPRSPRLPSLSFTSLRRPLIPFDILMLIFLFTFVSNFFFFLILQPFCLTLL